MRIGIDARLAGFKHGGIGRYTEELLRYLTREKTSHQWIVFLFEKGQLPWLERASNVKIVYAPIQHYTFAEQLKLPQIFNAEHLDLLHVPHFNIPLAYSKPYVVTIHDLLWHERREKNATTLSPGMYFLKYHAYKFISETAIRNARAVFVPTEHVKRIVLTHAKKQRVVVTPEGIAQAYVVKGSKAKRPYQYLIYTGSLYPHKNVPYILDVLVGMQEFHLVIVSGRSVFQNAFIQEVNKRSLQDRVHVETMLEDNEIARLYRGAVAFITPSFSEGFGLPGLEALACGALVFASDIPVFHEVYGDAATYINPNDSVTAIRAITTVINHKELPVQLRMNAQRFVKNYSWQDMANKTLQTYESLKVLL